MTTAHAEMFRSGLFYVVSGDGEVVIVDRPPEPVPIKVVDTPIFDFDLETRRARAYLPASPEAGYLKYNPSPWDEPVRKNYYAPPVTKWPSGVYLIRNTGTGRIKIGYANDPDKRLNNLQVGSDHELEIVGVIPGDTNLEKQIQEEYEDLNVRGEWFSEEVLAALMEDYPQWL